MVRFMTLGAGALLALALGAATVEGTTLRMKAPAARFFRTDGAVTRFSATVGFDPAIYTLKRKYEGAHLRETLMGFRVYADGRLVADTGLVKPGDGTRVIEADVAGARLIVLESVDGGYWLGTPQLLALWQDVRFAGAPDARVQEDVSGAETPQFGILTPDAAPAPHFTGAWQYGVRPRSPILHRIAVVGAGPMALSIDGPLPKGLAFDAKRRLLTGTLEARGDYRIPFVAKNAHGQARRTLVISVGDKLCLTPPMGWSAWNAWRCEITDGIVRDTARAFVEKGLADTGWTYVNLDDGWQYGAHVSAESARNDPKRRGKTRNDDGTIRPNGHFPDMKALADHLHALGLKFGIYSSPGPRTCARYEGSYGHEAQDAATWSAWGVDYVKYDWCSYTEIFQKELAGRAPTDEDRIKPFRILYRELLQQPRDMVYSFSGGGARLGEENGANLYRTWGDLKDGWGCVLNAARSTAARCQSSHPGYWADPDMLVVGRLHTGVLGEHDTLLTPNEQYAHVSMWSILNAPLILGCRMNALDAFTTRLLVNPEVIDINQDVAHPPARLVIDADDEWAFVKELRDGSKAVCVVNLRPFRRRVKVDFRRLGLADEVTVRDVWRRCGLGAFKGAYDVELPPHAPLYIRVRTHAASAEAPCRDCDR